MRKGRGSRRGLRASIYSAPLPHASSQVTGTSLLTATSRAAHRHPRAGGDPVLQRPGQVKVPPRSARIEVLPRSGRGDVSPRSGWADLGPRLRGGDGNGCSASLPHQREARGLRAPLARHPRAGGDPVLQRPGQVKVPPRPGRGDVSPRSGWADLGPRLRGGDGNGCSATLPHHREARGLRALLARHPRAGGDPVLQRPRQVKVPPRSARIEVLQRPGRVDLGPRLRGGDGNGCSARRVFPGGARGLRVPGVGELRIPNPESRIPNPGAATEVAP